MICKAFAALAVLVAAATDISTAAAETVQIATFDAAGGEHAENIAVANDGTVYVSLLAGGLYIRLPGGVERRVRIGGAHASLTGLAFDRSGALLIGVDRMGGSGSKGVWRLARGADAAAQQVLTLPASAKVNGVAVDAADRIYVADSTGTIWRGRAGETPTRWMQDGAIAAVVRRAVVEGEPGPELTVGPNGLKHRDGELYVSVSGRASLIAVRIGERPGAVRTVLRRRFVDDFTFDRDGNLVVASDAAQVLATGVDRALGADTVVRLAGTSEGLQQPSAIAVEPGSGRLLVTTLGLFGSSQRPGLFAVTPD